MKILIVVDSIYGNTYKIAEAIKNGLGKNDVKLLKAVEAKSEQIKEIDLLIIGSPTHGGRPSVNTQKFLAEIPNDGLKNIEAAAFDTGVSPESQGGFVKFVINFFGYASKRIIDLFYKKGAKIVGKETFFVLGKEGPLKKGELERAKKWAGEIIKSTSLTQKTVTLHCFTPLATLATFVIEILFALYAFLKYKTRTFARTAILILICLGLFQLSEYLICKTSYNELFTKIGYISITLLPPLGINLIELATKNKLYSKIAYLAAAIFSLVIIFVPVFISTTCPGKFVVFTNLPFFDIVYSIYYYSLLAIGVIVLIYHIFKNNENKNLLVWMLVGYGSFIVPTVILYLIEKITHSSVVSIMCGFAILFAIIMVAKILPLEKSSIEKRN